MEEVGLANGDKSLLMVEVGHGHGVRAHLDLSKVDSPHDGGGTHASSYSSKSPIHQSHDATTR